MNIYTDVDKAIIYTKEKKYSKAEEIYKNILKIEPNNSVILSMLGLLYLESGALKTHGDGPFVFGKAHRKAHRNTRGRSFCVQKSTQERTQGDDPFVLTSGKCFSPKRNTLGRSFCVCWKSPRGNTWEQP